MKSSKKKGNEDRARGQRNESKSNQANMEDMKAVQQLIGRQRWQKFQNLDLLNMEQIMGLHQQPVKTCFLN